MKFMKKIFSIAILSAVLLAGVSLSAYATVGQLCSSGTPCVNPQLGETCIIPAGQSSGTCQLANAGQPGEITSCTIRHTFNIGGIPCVKSDTACSLSNDTSNCASCCIADKIYSVTDWIFLAVMGLSIIFILIGAFMFVTAGGSAEKALQGRQYLIYAVIGIIIALIAKAIPYIAKSIMGLS
jgi:hypothetical protein